MCAEVCMANVKDGLESPRWTPAILGVRTGESEIRLVYVVMMEVRTYLIHIKQSLCPYMVIHMSQSTVILFQSLEELQS